MWLPVAKQLGVSAQSLDRLGKVAIPNATDREEVELKDVRRENLKLKAELRRVQEERDILKKVAAYVAKIRVRYAFILQHQDRHAVLPMCRLLGMIRESHEAGAAPMVPLAFSAIWVRVGEQKSNGQAHKAPQGPRPAQLQAARHLLHQASGGCTESIAAIVCDGQTGSGAGERQHLYSARQRVALPGGGDGSLLAKDFWLVDEGDVGQRDRAGRLTDGRGATQARA